MNTFVTALNCMDGRVQVPVYEYMKNKYNVDYVDVITAPVINKVIADNVVEDIKPIKKCID